MGNVNLVVTDRDSFRSGGIATSGFVKYASVTITPTSSSSKIRLFANFNIQNQSSTLDSVIWADIRKGSTSIAFIQDSVAEAAEDKDDADTVVLAGIDEPNTTSPVTYDLYLRASSSGGSVQLLNTGTGAIVGGKPYAKHFEAMEIAPTSQVGEGDLTGVLLRNLPALTAVNANTQIFAEDTAAADATRSKKLDFMEGVNQVIPNVQFLGLSGFGFAIYNLDDLLGNNVFAFNVRDISKLPSGDMTLVNFQGLILYNSSFNYANGINRIIGNMTSTFLNSLKSNDPTRNLRLQISKGGSVFIDYTFLRLSRT